MKGTITAQVVRLDGNLTSLIMQNRAGDIGNIAAFPGELPMPQHLYFTSDEPIQDGNWLFERGEWGIKSVCQSMGNWTKEDHLKYPNDKKIIASTDPSLGLPNIPKSFLKQYVAANGKIDKVRLQTRCCGIIANVADCHITCNKFILELTAANEVVVDIVGTMLEYKGLTNLLDVFPDEDKELEEAAKEWVDSFYQKEKEYSKVGRNKCSPQSGFIAGAEWQKEQSANEAIEFAEWTRSQEDLGYIPEDKIWGYVTRDENGEFTDDTEYTSKQLYELWQQLRKKIE
jgi:hypothetical protein